MQRFHFLNGIRRLSTLHSPQGALRAPPPKKTSSEVSPSGAHTRVVEQLFPDGASLPRGPNPRTRVPVIDRFLLKVKKIASMCFRPQGQNIRYMRIIRDHDGFLANVRRDGRVLSSLVLT